MRLISGLGNQLFQYAIGRHLSLKHQVPLKLDTTFFSGQSLRTFTLDKFNINAAQATQDEIDSFLFLQKDLGLKAKIYRKIEKLVPRSKRKYFKELEWWSYDPDLMNTSSNVYLDGYWQHHKYFENINPRVIQELTLKEVLPQTVELEKEIVADRNSVSIHIRRGDYITDANALSLMGVMQLDYYQNAISFMNKNLGAPVYYVFSDDLDWAKNHLNLQRPVKFVDINGGASDFVELDLMSKCANNIIANSSFSWWGAFLNSNPQKLVVCPKNWVARPQVNERVELQFPSWTKM